MSRWRFWRQTGIFICLSLLTADLDKRYSARGQHILSTYSGSLGNGDVVSQSLARLQESLRAKFNVWRGRGSTEDGLRPLVKAYKEYRRTICSYFLNQEAVTRFNVRCGGNLELKRANQFRPWGGKRSPIQPTELLHPSEYLNKLSDSSFPNQWEDEGNDQFHGTSKNLYTLPSNPEETWELYDEREKKEFNAWAGKRGERFNAWAGKRGQYSGKFDPNNWTENRTYFNYQVDPQLYDNFDLFKINLRQIRAPMKVPYIEESTPLTKWGGWRPRGTKLAKLAAKIKQMRQTHGLNRRGQGFKPWAGKRSQKDLYDGLPKSNNFRVGEEANEGNAVYERLHGSDSRSLRSSKDSEIIESQRRSFNVWGGKRGETTTALNM